MGSSRPNTIYELFASLNLDTSNLDPQLAKATLNINNASEALAALQAQGFTAGAAMRALGAEFDGVAIRSVASTENVRRQLLSTGTEDIVGKLTANAELKRIAAERAALEAESANEVKRIADNRKAQQLRDVAADKEYLSLKAQLRAQEQAANKAAKAADDSAFGDYMAGLERRRSARLADIAMERQLANQAFATRQQADLERFGGAPSRGGIGAEIRSSFYLGGALQAMGVNVPMGLTSIIGRLEQVQLAVASAFNLFAIGAFVSILVGVKDKLVEVWDVARGFGPEFKEIWLSAAETIHATVMELVSVRDKINEVREAGLKGTDLLGVKEENVEKRIDLIKRLLASHGEALTGFQQVRDVLKAEQADDPRLMLQLGLDEYAKRLEVMHRTIQQEGGMANAIEKTTKLYEIEAKVIKDLTKQLGDAEREKEKIRRKEETESDKKRRDPVHELPWRLPWFMGEVPADFFLKSLSEAPARQGNFQPRTASSGVNFTPHFAPVMHFDGIPADVQRFVQDKMMPELEEMYRNNTREAMDKLKANLQNAGV